MQFLLVDQILHENYTMLMGHEIFYYFSKLFDFHQNYNLNRNVNHIYDKRTLIVVPRPPNFHTPKSNIITGIRKSMFNLFPPKIYSPLTNISCSSSVGVKFRYELSLSSIIKERLVTTIIKSSGLTTRT